ncbi:signal peptidase II [Candidatus Falkowbacteria bacterium]|nr:signal peptidase II [Candidatus Falkowbacteria bacterium]
MFFLNKKTTTLILVIVFFVVLDRFLKFLAVINYFNFTKNYNIAFSLPLGGAVLNFFIVSIIFGLIYYLLRLIKNGRYEAAVFLLAIILGAASNLLDRFKYGYVIDYLDLKYFTVFNLADVMIVAGVAGLLWSLRSLDVKKRM